MSSGGPDQVQTCDCFTSVQTSKFSHLWKWVVPHEAVSHSQEKKEIVFSTYGVSN